MGGEKRERYGREREWKGEMNWREMNGKAMGSRVEAEERNWRKMNGGEEGRGRRMGVSRRWEGVGYGETTERWDEMRGSGTVWGVVEIETLKCHTAGLLI
jgi:hypothetical protein